MILALVFGALLATSSPNAIDACLSTSVPLDIASPLDDCYVNNLTLVSTAVPGKSISCGDEVAYSLLQSPPDVYLDRSDKNKTEPGNKSIVSRVDPQTLVLKPYQTLPDDSQKKRVLVFSVFERSLDNSTKAQVTVNTSNAASFDVDDWTSTLSKSGVKLCAPLGTARITVGTDAHTTANPPSTKSRVGRAQVGTDTGEATTEEATTGNVSLTSDVTHTPNDASADHTEPTSQDTTPGAQRAQTQPPAGQDVPPKVSGAAMPKEGQGNKEQGKESAGVLESLGKLIPGIVETTTGKGETTTGKGETTTGKGETTTGKGETTTGKGETTTGKGETTTGKSETTTGNGQTTPGNDGTTAPTLSKNFGAHFQSSLITIIILVTLSML